MMTEGWAHHWLLWGVQQCIHKWQGVRESLDLVNMTVWTENKQSTLPTWPGRDSVTWLPSKGIFCSQQKCVSPLITSGVTLVLLQVAGKSLPEKNNPLDRIWVFLSGSRYGYSCNWGLLKFSKKSKMLNKTRIRNSQRFRQSASSVNRTNR